MTLPAPLVLLTLRAFFLSSYQDVNVYGFVPTA